MDAKQFAWMYMIENGVAGHEHGFYGGWDILPDVLEQYKFKKDKYNRVGIEEVARVFREEILDVGVDWHRTADVQSETTHQFTDTFHDPETREILTGELVLLDGTVQHWMSDPIEVANVFEMMAQVSGAAAKFQEIFGRQP
jgi:hypothetical protein